MSIRQFLARVSCGVLLSCATAATPLLAQTPSTATRPSESRLHGRVTDTQGRPIAGATIVIRLSSGLERVLVSDSEGRYATLEPINGAFTIAASASDFSRQERQATPDTLSGASIDFTLDPRPVVEHVTVVSGTRQDELRESLNTRVDIVTREGMRDSGADTAGDVLQELPGVLTRRGSEGAGAAGEQIQGIDSRQVLVLLDGQPIVGARGIKRGAIDLDRQSVSRLERIEVVKGASSALYGSDAIGGVVNLITRDAVAPVELSGLLTGGNRGASTTNGDIGWRRQRWTGLFSLERHHVDSFDLTPTTFDTTGAELRRFDELAKVRGQVRDNLGVSLFGSAYQNESKGRSNGELGPEDDRVTDKGQYLNAAADWQATPRVSVQARGYLGRYDEDTTATLATGAALDPANLDERYGKADATANVILDDHQVLQGGVEWMTDRYQGTNRLYDDSGVDAQTAVVWAQHRLGLWNRATVTSGLRYDHHSAFGSAVSPKLAVNARVTDDVRLRASYGRGFRAPDLGQLYYRFLNPTNFYQVIGNPNLQPERANSYQVGGEYTTPNRRVRVSVNGFRNDVRNLIESYNFGTVTSTAQLQAILDEQGIDGTSFRPVLGRMLFIYRNLSNIKTQGVEADSEWAVTRSLSVAGAYTYLDAEDKVSGLRLTGRHPHQGNVRAAWRHDAWGLRANLRGTFYSSWINTRAASGVETIAPKFALWDLFVAQRITRGLDALVAVENLADSRDPNSGALLANGNAAPIYRPEYGRTVRFGLRFDWARR